MSVSVHRLQMVARGAIYSKMRLMKNIGLTTTKMANETEVRPPLTTLYGHRLLSIESLQQFLQTDISCRKCNEKLRSQWHNNSYKQAIKDLQTYLYKESNTKNQ